MARTVEVRKRIERILDETRQIPRGLTRGRWAALIACSLPLLYVTSAAQLAPAQDIRLAPQAEYARPAETAVPQAAEAVLAQTRPAAAAPSSMPGLAGLSPAQSQENHRSESTNPFPREPETKYSDARLWVLYFDLRGMSADDQVRAQNGAQKFILSQMTPPTDKVAIMTNAGELKVLQDFTDDRGLLLHAVLNLTGSGDQASRGSSIPDSSQRLTALESALRMLAPFAGRKALMYFGSGSQRDGFADSAQLRTTIDAALRANVASTGNAEPAFLFYPVDATGLAGAVFQSVVTASSQPPYPYIAPIDLSPIQKVDPVYPAEAIGAGVQGDVQFRIIVGTDGHVRSAQLIRGNPLLAPFARDAVIQYLYAPFKMSNGEGAEIDTTVTVPFRLNGPLPAQPPVQTPEPNAPNLPPNGDRPPTLLRKVEPEYPFELRAQKIQGTVTLAVTIGADGVPKDIRVTQSADPGLDAQALATASRWRFSPARRDGQPVGTPATIQMSFRLQ